MLGLWLRCGRPALAVESIDARVGSHGHMKKPDDGGELIATGLGVGAIGVAGTLLLGATCPVCVVATPALLGAGLYKKWRARQTRADAPMVSVEEPQQRESDLAQTPATRSE